MKKGECDQTVEDLCMEALRIKSEQLGEDHVQVAEILNNIAMLRDMQGNNAKALELTQKALTIQEQQFGRSHVSSAHSLHCKALFLKKEGELDEAVKLCKEAIKARKELLGEEHLDVASSLFILSEIRLEQGAHEKALENCAEALSIRRSKLGPEHIDVASCLHHAGKIYLRLDREDDTLQVFLLCFAPKTSVLSAVMQSILLYILRSAPIFTTPCIVILSYTDETLCKSFCDRATQRPCRFAANSWEITTRIRLL